MRRTLLSTLSCSLVGMTTLTTISRAGDGELLLSRLTVAAGFEVIVAAAPPLVERPIVADFDDQGRLYVAESSGSNESVHEQLEKKPHSILRLEDTDGDGRFDRRIVFADRLMFPEGALWFRGSLYVAAPPSIWKLTDTDEDGVADAREEWFQGKTLTGCANDLHGPYAGPDGWIYWCKGAFAEQRYDRPGKSPWVTRAAHIFRCRPDGSGIECVMTGGMDNPVEVAFTPGGERIFTTTFLQHPGGGQRDGLLHAIYGGVYGKIHGVLDDHPRTGDVMPVLTHLGPAAPCGLMRYESTVFGPEYQDNLFAALFNLRKVTRHVLVPSGATFRTEDSDFLVSESPDFHPTDVLEDADGSLLVVDTGGWYKICCPTSQLWKPDVLGAIYRIRRKESPAAVDPRGLQQDWKTADAQMLAGRLDDPRPTVRNRAVERLASLAADAVPALRDTLQQGRQRQRLAAVWALTRVDDPGARVAVREALFDSYANVRVAAAHSLSVWRDQDGLSALLSLLEDSSSSPPERRAAAEAIGRLGDQRAVVSLLDAAAGDNDRVLEHSLIYALIEIGDAATTRQGLERAGRARRAALIALDQMDGGQLASAAVAPLLDDADPLLRQTAHWIVGRHPEWAPELATWLRARLAKPFDATELATFSEQLVAFAGQPAVSDLLAETVASRQSTQQARLLALRVLGESKPAQLPPSWLAAIDQTLRADDEECVHQAVSTARQLGQATKGDQALVTSLLTVSRDANAAPQVRAEALAAAADHIERLEQPLFDFLRAHVSSEHPVALRTACSQSLASAKLDHEQLLALADTLTTVGPLELNTLLGAFERQTDEELGRRMVGSLRESEAMAAVRPDLLRACLVTFPAPVQTEGEALLAQLNVDLASQRSYLDQLQHNLPAGDIRRGQTVFNGTKAACATCHAIGYLGGTLGPDLTRIGQIRQPRDLLESIVFPSASLVRSYETMDVVTQSGQQYSGIVVQETPDEIVLTSKPDVRTLVKRADIEQVLPGKVSIMPAGMDKALSPQELADLLAFLLATRW